MALAAVLLKLHMKLAGSLVWPDPTQATRDYQCGCSFE